VEQLGSAGSAQERVAVLREYVQFVKAVKQIADALHEKGIFDEDRLLGIEGEVLRVEEQLAREAIGEKVRLGPDLPPDDLLASYRVEVAQELRRLQGMWKMTAWIARGAMPLKGIESFRCYIEGDALSIWNSETGDLLADTHFDVYPNETPKHFDLGNRQIVGDIIDAEGIYMLEQGNGTNSRSRFRISFGNPRPVKFSESPRCVHWEFERVHNPRKPPTKADDAREPLESRGHKAPRGASESGS